MTAEAQDLGPGAQTSHVNFKEQTFAAARTVTVDHGLRVAEMTAEPQNLGPGAQQSLS